MLAPGDMRTGDTELTEEGIENGSCVMGTVVRV